MPTSILGDGEVFLRSFIFVISRTDHIPKPAMSKHEKGEGAPSAELVGGLLEGLATVLVEGHLRHNAATHPFGRGKLVARALPLQGNGYPMPSLSRFVARKRIFPLRDAFHAVS